jgi:RNA polymerase sigma factor (sigma-70 family)
MQLTPNQTLLHKNVALVYKLMGKYGLNNREAMGDKGQFIWLCICKYVEGYKKERSAFGTWLGWAVWSAVKVYNKQVATHADRYKCFEDMLFVHDREHEDSQRDYLAHQKILDTMDRVLVSKKGGASHREVVRLCWEQGMPYRKAAKILGISGQRAHRILQVSRQKLQVELKEMEGELV